MAATILREATKGTGFEGMIEKVIATWDGKCEKTISLMVNIRDNILDNCCDGEMSDIMKSSDPEDREMQEFVDCVHSIAQDISLFDAEDRPNPRETPTSKLHRLEKQVCELFSFIEDCFLKETEESREKYRKMWVILFNDLAELVWDNPESVWHANTSFIHDLPCPRNWLVSDMPKADMTKCPGYRELLNTRMYVAHMLPLKMVEILYGNLKTIEDELRVEDPKTKELMEAFIRCDEYVKRTLMREYRLFKKSCRPEFLIAQQALAIELRLCACIHDHIINPVDQDTLQLAMKDLIHILQHPMITCVFGIALAERYAAFILDRYFDPHKIGFSYDFTQGHHDEHFDDLITTFSKCMRFLPEMKEIRSSHYDHVFQGCAGNDLLANYHEWYYVCPSVIRTL